MSNFTREERYIVVKIKDMSLIQRNALFDARMAHSIPTRECVVVERDWPIYEETWENVQRLVEGRPSIQEELGAKVFDQHKARAKVQMNLDAAESILNRFREENEKLEIERDAAIQRANRLEAELRGQASEGARHD